MISRATRRMATVSLADLKTLTQAYSDGSVQASGSQHSNYKPNGTLNDRISLWQGDITKIEVDAVQNAANKGLRGGGGIDGAIHRAAGNELYAACKRLNGCETGSTKITPAFDMPSKHILHTVGPIYDHYSPEESQNLLEGCYRSTLTLARDKKCKSVALCGVSTGVYGYPLEPAAKVALRTVRESLEEDPNAFERIIFCNFGDRDVEVYKRFITEYFPPVSESQKR